MMWNWRNACVRLIFTFSEITKWSLLGDFCWKFQLWSGLLLGNWFSLKIIKADTRSKNQSTAIIQSRIKHRADLNTMKTQNTPRKRSKESMLSSKIKSCRIKHTLRQPAWTKKTLGIWERMQETSWIRQFHKCGKQQPSLHNADEVVAFYLR